MNIVGNCMPVDGFVDNALDWLGVSSKVRREAGEAAAAAARPAAQEGVATMLSSSIATTVLVVGGAYLVYRLLR